MEKEISKYSWFVPVEEAIKRGYDLTARNPNKKKNMNMNHHKFWSPR